MVRRRSSFGFLLPSLRRGAGLEAETVVTGFNDVAVMRKAIQHGRGHFGIAKNVRPLAETEISRDRDTAAFVKLAHPVNKRRG
jgi:hypothetical protein